MLALKLSLCTVSLMLLMLPVLSSCQHAYSYFYLDWKGRHPVCIQLAFRATLNACTCRLCATCEVLAHAHHTNFKLTHAWTDRHGSITNRMLKNMKVDARMPSAQQLYM